MAEIATIRAETRERAGKGAARATRRAGRVPAVIYGDKKEPVLVSLDPREFDRVLRKPGFFAKLLDVTLDGATHRTLPRDVQLHPVNEQALHVDFMRVGPNTKVTVGVPVRFINQDKAPGLKRGGIVNVVRHEIDLVCRADSIPEFLTVDLDGIDIGDSIHINQVKLPEGTASAITERDFTIASIAAPTVVREEQAAGAAAAAAAAAAAEAGVLEGAPTVAPTGAGAGAAPGSAGAAPAAGAAAKPGAPAPKGGGDKKS
ncbi:MAG TPA: 50S ribosomal protein L25/general stress protein Ctc [Stellaceae bacterium]|nr:50S ribosomal protein L25/general stress protein Ctc [Stellaceae bacterium]